MLKILHKLHISLSLPPSLSLSLSLSLPRSLALPGNHVAGNYSLAAEAFSRAYAIDHRASGPQREHRNRSMSEGESHPLHLLLGSLTLPVAAAAAAAAAQG